MSSASGDIGVVGLGVMGANIARNFASRGHEVIGYARNVAHARELADEDPSARFVAVDGLPAMLARLARPRRILLMVPAGAPVDDVLDRLDPILEADDIVVDGGNSHFADTDRRHERSAGRPWRFVGTGVSGGAEGARRGPSIMPGGDHGAWLELRPLLESIAARSESGPCVTYCGRGSAGHFVKMVHNGIEYGDMQLIAETGALLRRGLGLDAAAVADVFGEWNSGELESYLIEITADIFRAPDPKRSGALLLDAVLDKAGQKGTGRWTIAAALDLGVAVPTLAAAVDARALSSEVLLRAEAEQVFGGPRAARVEGVAVDDLRDALYAAKITSYAQGFALLQRASEARDYGTNLAEVARIWKAGCIIRAQFLDDVSNAFAREPDRLLALADGFRDALTERSPALRRVVAQASLAGVPVPGFAASLAWLDTLTTARGSADLIQAQRDAFGRHGFERIDAPGEAINGEWRGSSEG